MMSFIATMLKSENSARAFYLLGALLLLALVFLSGLDIGATMHDVFHGGHA